MDGGEDVAEFRHSIAMLRQAGRSRQQAGLLCYTSGVIRLGCTGFWRAHLACAGGPAAPSNFSRRAMAAGIHCASLRAFRRGKDFEQEKSLDERRRRLGGCRRAGRLWNYYLFCWPRPAAQRVGQSRPDRDPESQRIHQGRAAVWTPITTFASATTTRRVRSPSRIFRSAAGDHPEYAENRRAWFTAPATAVSR